jgi:hypothetical protein
LWFSENFCLGGSQFTWINGTVPCPVINEQTWLLSKDF